MEPSILVVSHRRSGTHLMVDLLRNNFAPYEKGEDYSSSAAVDRLSSHKEKHVSVASFEERLPAPPYILASHSRADIDHYFQCDDSAQNFVDKLFLSLPLIYVYRDGRDVMTSLYFYLQRFRAEMKGVSFSDFLRMPEILDAATHENDISHVEYWRNHVRGWLVSGRPHHAICFETMVENTAECINAAADFARIARPKRIVDAVKRSSVGDRIKGVSWRLGKTVKHLEQRFGAARSVSSTSVSFRKGRVGDWRNHFSQADKEYFRETCGDLLVELGYEKDNNW